jgi:hypothetical protein
MTSARLATRCGRVRDRLHQRENGTDRDEREEVEFLTLSWFTDHTDQSKTMRWARRSAETRPRRPTTAMRRGRPDHASARRTRPEDEVLRRAEECQDRGRGRAAATRQALPALFDGIQATSRHAGGGDQLLGILSCAEGVEPQPADFVRTGGAG